MIPKGRPFLGVIAIALMAVSCVHRHEKLAGHRRVERLNYYLGTQTFGIRYQFTEKTSLVETAERIHEMGSNILKFSMNRRDTDKDRYGLPENKGIRTLRDMAEKEPSVRTVLDMPFAYYHIWVYPFAHEDNAWVDGLSEREEIESYTELYDLVRYLRRVYRGTGKTFLLGHWEGDWYLSYSPNEAVTPTKIQGMISWLNVRQRAIDDAKRDTKNSDVEVYHYTEANLVQKGMKGGRCLVNDVLPQTSVDFVSYSSYDTIYPHMGNVREALWEALDYIESKLAPKAVAQGKRVFIGEYGFALERAKTPQKQDQYARDVCLAALEWGCPYVLYWEMYCNENPGGRHRGFWLVDDRNRKQPFYHTLERYHEAMKRFAETFENLQQRLPTDAELRGKALEVLKRDGVTR